MKPIPEHNLQSMSDETVRQIAIDAVRWYTWWGADSTAEVRTMIRIAGGQCREELHRRGLPTIWGTPPKDPITRNLTAPRGGWAKKVYAVPRLEGGDGWDIVIRIDGTYSDWEGGDVSGHSVPEMLEYWNEQLPEFLNSLGKTE